MNMRDLETETEYKTRPNRLFKTAGDSKKQKWNSEDLKGEKKVFQPYSDKLRPGGEENKQASTDKTRSSFYLVLSTYKRHQGLL